MDKRTYARGEYEESKEQLDSLRFEYRALSQSAVKAINICEVGIGSLQNDDLGNPEEAMPVITKLQDLKPKMQLLQKKVQSLQTTWKFK